MTAGRAAGIAIGFVLLYTAAGYLELPRVVVIQGAEMGYYGLLLWGLLGAVVGGFAGGRLGARAGAEGMRLATAWTATALLVGAAFFLWHNWP